MSEYTEDERVVSMRFEDSNFQKGAKRAKKTLTELEDAISMKNVPKESMRVFESLAENVEKIASKSYSIVDRYVDKIRQKVSDTLYDITINSTLGQIEAGWQKFADKTTAVGTLVSQGNALRDVNEQLEKLNWYTDETSYNFVDMVSNIGKFTAAGQSLEDSEKAMMGIANWAALSGQNAATASRAMYQLSQAMGAGVMRREDYRSIQTANMDTVEFKQKCLDAAVALGTLRKEANGTYTSIAAGGKAVNFTIDSFANNLTEGAWFTKEVMMEVYATYGSAVDRIKEITEDEDLGIATAADALKYIEAQNEETVKKFKNVTHMANGEEKKEIEQLNKIKDKEERIRTAMEKYNLTLEESTDLIEDLSTYVDEFGIKAFKAAQEARTFSDAVGSLKDAVSTKFMTIFEYIFGDYYKAKTLWTDFANWLYDVFAAKLDTLSEVMRQWSEGDGELGGRSALMRGVYGFAEAISTIVNEFRALEDRVNPVEKRVERLKWLSSQIERIGGRIYMMVQQLRGTEFFSNIYYTVRNIKETLISLASTALEAIKSIFPNIDSLPNVLVLISRRLLKLSNIFKVGGETLGGTKRILEFVLKVIKTLANLAGKLLEHGILPLLDKALNFLDDIAYYGIIILDTITNMLTPIIDLGDGLFDLGESINNPLDKLRELGGVGEWIANIIDNYVKPGIGILAGLFKKASGSIGDFFTEGALQGKASKLLGLFGTIGEFIKNAFGDFSNLKAIMLKFADNPTLGGFLTLAIDLFDELISKVRGLFDAFNEIESHDLPVLLKIPLLLLSFASKLYDSLTYIYNNVLRPILTEIIKLVDGTLGKIIEALKVGDIETVLDIINGIFTTGVLAKLRTLFTTIDTLLGRKGLQGLFESLAKAANAFALEQKAEALERFSSGLLKLAVAMGMIAGIAAAVVLLFPEDKLLEFAAIVGIAAIGLVGLAAAMYSFGIKAEVSVTKMLRANIGIIAFSMAIMAVVLSIKVLSSAIKQYGVGIVVVAGLLTTILPPILALVAGKIGKKANLSGTIFKIGVFLAGLAAVMMAFTFALNNLVIDDTILQKLGIMSMALIMCGVLLKIMQTDGTKHATFGVKNALALAALIAVVGYVLMPIIRDVADDTTDFGRVFAAIGSIGLLAISLGAALNLVGMNENGFLKNIAVVFGFKMVLNAISEHLLPAIGGILEGDHKWYEYLALGGLLSALLLSVGGIFLMVSKSFSNIASAAKDANIKNVAGIILVLGGIVSILITAVTASVMQLAKLNIGNAIAGSVIVLAGIGTLLLEIVGMINFLSGTIQENGSLNVESITKYLSIVTVLLTTTLVTFTAAVVLFSQNIGRSIGGAVIAVIGSLSIILGIMFAMEHMLKTIDSLKRLNSDQSLAFMDHFMKLCIALMAVSFGGIATLVALSPIAGSPENLIVEILGMIAVISTMFYGISKLVKTINGLKDNMKHIEQMKALFTGCISTIAVAVAGMSTLLVIMATVSDNTSKWVTFGTAVLSMYAALGTLWLTFLLLKKMSDVDLNIGKVMSITVGFALLIGEMVLLTLAMKSLTEEMDFKRWGIMALTIITMVGALGLLSIVVTDLSNIGVAKLAEVAMGIAALGASLYVLASGLEKLGGWIAGTLNGAYEKAQDQHSPSKKWATYGKYLVDGLGIGIKKEGKKILPNSVDDLTDMTNGEFCEAMGIHSPSQVMFQNGVYIVQGLVDGMGSPYQNKRLKNKSQQAGVTIGEGVEAGTKSALDKFLEDIETNIFGENGDAKTWFKSLFSGAGSDIADDLWTNINTPDEETIVEYKMNGQLMEMNAADWLEGRKYIMGKQAEAYMKGAKNGEYEYVRTFTRKGKSKIEKVGESLGFNFATAFTSDGVIGKLIDGLRDKIMYKGDGSKTAVGEVIDAFTDDGAKGGFKKIGEAIGGSISDWIDSTDASNKFSEMGKNIGDGIKESIEISLGSFFDEMGENIKALWNKIIHPADSSPITRSWLYGGAELVEKNKSGKRATFYDREIGKYYKGNNPMNEIATQEFVAVNKDLSELTQEELDLFSELVKVWDPKEFANYLNWAAQNKIGAYYDDKTGVIIMEMDTALSYIADNLDELEGAEGFLKDYAEDLAKYATGKSPDKDNVKPKESDYSMYYNRGAMNPVEIAEAIEKGIYHGKGVQVVEAIPADKVITFNAANEVFDEIAHGDLEVKSNIVSVSDSAVSPLYLEEAPSDNAFGNALTKVDSSVYDSTDKALRKAEAAPVNTNMITPQDINAIGASIVSAIIQQKNQGIDVNITLDNPALLQAVVNEDKNYKRNHGRSAFAY